MEHSQQGIDALPDLLCGQLALDPSIIADVSKKIVHACVCFILASIKSCIFYNVHKDERFFSPSFQFLSLESEHMPVPDYDMVDTAVSHT